MMTMTETFAENLLACFDWPSFVTRCNKDGELEPTIEILQDDPERTQSLARILPSVLCAIVSSYAVEIHAIPFLFRLSAGVAFISMHITPSCKFRFRIACVSGMMTCSYLQAFDNNNSSPFRVKRPCCHIISCNHVEVFRYYMHHTHQLDLFTSDPRRSVRCTAKNWFSLDEQDQTKCVAQLKFKDHALAKHYLLLVDCVYKNLFKWKAVFRSSSIHKLCNSYYVQFNPAQ